MLIPWPEAAKQETVTMRLRRAGQTSISPYTGKATSVFFGGALWDGDTVLAQYNLDDIGTPLALAVEDFIDDMTDQRNWTELPTLRPAAVFANDPQPFTAPAVNGGVLMITVAGSHDDLAAGQYARIGDRTYKVRSFAGGIVSLIPGILPATGVTTVSGTQTVRAKLDPDGDFATPGTLTTRGPWTLTWREDA